MRPQPMHLDGLPPPHVPFRFFLTAPLFGIAAAIVLLVAPAAWTTRWNDATFAAVHLIALGFVSMVMAGSLFQVIPVLGGRPIAHATIVATWIHAALTVGTALIGVAFVHPDAGTWPAAMLLFGAGFGTLLVAAGRAVLRRGPVGDSIFVARLAIAALLVTLALGLVLATSRAWPETLPDARRWTHVHLLWGFAGWIALLVMAVSFQVVPMFQVAPAFHSRLARGTALVLFAALVVLPFADAGWAFALATSTIAAALVVYAGHALSVLARRKRRRADALNRFWQLSLASLIATAVLGHVLACEPQWVGGHVERAQALLGVLALVGVVMSVMLGMMLKIAAFLAFLHLQRRCLLDVSVAHLLPTMDAFVSERSGRVMLCVHAATVAAAITAALWPASGNVAASLLLVDFAVLWWLLVVAASRYFVAADTIGAALAAKATSAE